MKHTRKYLLATALILAMVFSFAACTAPTTTEGTEPPAVQTAAPVQTLPPDAAFAQAPMLDALVADGSLPAVEDRLPESPFVLAPRDEIGVYGQTMYSAFPSAYAGQAFETAGFYEPVLTWNADRTELVPNLLEAFEPSADQKTFRMTIRKGLKWSDGEAVTTEDIEFAYNDVWLNTDINPAPPSAFSVGGELCTLNVIDEYTFELAFTQAYPSFVYVLCRQGFTNQLFMPSHYLEQFHINYAAEAELAQMTQDAGFDTWNQLFGARNTFQNNPDRPCLFAWDLETLSDDNLVRVFTRNPYFFKVDTAGNQLPYLDHQQIEYVENAETLKMKTLAGENEYIGAPLGEIMADWPMFAENTATGNYRMITAGSDFIHIMLVMPNASSADPQKGPLLSNKDFRIALSKAINREEIISLFVAVGDFAGTPSQQAPHKDSPYYDEEMATQYTEYDTASANEILDSLGIEARGADGYRLGPDGQAMTFQIMIPTYSQSWVDVGNLVAKYWREVGLNVEAKAVDPTIWNETVQANQLDFSIHSTGSGGLMVINSDGIDAYSMPYVGWMQRWGVGYVKYILSDGAEGVEPPEYVYELNQLRQEILYEADPAVADQKVTELLGIWKENFPLIGLSTPLPQWMLISNDLKNTPQNDEPWVIFMFGVGGNVNPCQFYKQP